MTPDSRDLQQKIKHLARENARLRDQLTVTQHGNPPLELEEALQSVIGWQCLTVSLPQDSPALILVAGTVPGAEPQDLEAAGQIWRYLLTAAPASGRIGPYSRAPMPHRLLGYLSEQDGYLITVLNEELPRGRLAQAARTLRSHAKIRCCGPHLLDGRHPAATGMETPTRQHQPAGRRQPSTNVDGVRVADPRPRPYQDRSRSPHTQKD